jgi:Tfp pilus assembly protein PilF
MRRRMRQFLAQRNHLALGALLALTALLWSPVLEHGLVYDDHVALEANPAVQEPTVGLVLGTGFWGPAEAGRIATWRPLATATFALDVAVARLAGAGPGATASIHHASGLLVFLGLVAVVFHFVGALGGGLLARGLAAALVACHPLISEAVAFTVARADLLAALAGLGLVLAWLRGRYLVALLLLAAALLAKESSLLLPLGALIAVWPGPGEAPGRTAAGEGGAPGIGPRLAWLAVAALIALWVLARVAVLGSLDGPPPSALENPLVDADLPGRLGGALAVWGLGLRLLLVPTGLSADWGAGAFPEGVLHPLLGGGAVVAGVVAFVWLRTRRGPRLGLALIGLPALFASHLLHPLPTGFGERMWVLPVVGLALLVALGAERLVAARPRALLPVLLVGATLMGAGVLGLRQRLPDWRSDQALFEAMLRTHPRGFRGLLNAGAMALERGEVVLARQRLELALGVAPDAVAAWLALAQIEVAAGAKGRAERALVAAEVRGGRTDRLQGVACAFAVRFEPPAAAVAACRLAVAGAAGGRSALVRMYLALALDRAGYRAEAESAMARAGELRADRSPLVDLNAGVLWARRGQLARARPLLEGAALAMPGHAQARGAARAVCRLLADSRAPEEATAAQACLARLP